MGRGRRKRDMCIGKLRLPGGEVSWLLYDAKWMAAIGGRESALLLLLCAADGLAKAKYPEHKYPEYGRRGGIGKRFMRYVSEMVFPKIIVCKSLQIQVMGAKDYVPFEKVLWQYLRGEMVHRGSRVAVGEGTQQVLVDWKEDSRLIIGRHGDERVAMVGGNWVLEVLFRLVESGVTGREPEILVGHGAKLGSRPGTGM